MYRIDNATNVAVLPTPAAAGVNPDGYFTKGAPESGTPATIVDQDWANHVQEELCAIVEDSGVTLDKSDMGQVLVAIKVLIQGNLSNWTTSASSPNTYTADLTPAITAYTAGTIAFIKFTNANTGAATINLNSLGAKDIKKPDGTALNSGDIAAGMIAILMYDGTNYQLLNASLSAIAIQNSQYITATDTGSADAYAMALAPAITAYADGCHILLEPANTNTGASTVNINALGVKNIKLVDGSDPYAGAMLAGGKYKLTYDGTNFQLQNPTPSVAMTNNVYSYAADTGAADAYAIAPTPAITAYVAGQGLKVLITNANTGASTIDVSSLGVKTITNIDGAALVAGDIVAGMIAYFMYDGTNFQLLNPASALGSGNNANLIDNSDFSVAQQGTSFTAATTPANNDDSYLLDRWILLSDGNDIFDVSQESTIVPDGAAKSAKLEVATANKKGGLFQILTANNSRELIGDVATLSFEVEKVVGNATLDKLRAAIVSWDGTADAVTSDIVSAWGAEGVDPTLVANWTYENTPSDLTLTDSFQKFTIDNIAIDTSGAKNVGIFIWVDNTDATAADLVYLSKVKLEKSAQATDYVKIPQREENQECAYHMRVFNANNRAAIANAFFNTTKIVLYGLVTLLPGMRVAPTITQSGTVSHFYVKRAGSSTDNAASLQAATQIGTESFNLNWTIVNTATALSPTALELTSTATITVDANL